MRRALLFLLVLSAPSLFAIEIFPPMVDSHTGIRFGFLANACPPIGHAALSGSTILLTSTGEPGFLCITTHGPQPAVANLGPLPPGVYNVQTELGEHAQLIVRDADSDIAVSPVGISVSAKNSRIVQVFSDRLIGGNVAVTFDGVPAKVDSLMGDHAVVVIPPAHAAGTVDVTMTDDVGTEKAVAAFTYFDPAAPVDPQLFEPLLYPVSYYGPGIFGSQWSTQNEIGAGNTLVRFRDQQLVALCDGACGALNWSGLLTQPSQSGLLVWVVRRRIPPGLGIDDELRASSRIVEISNTYQVTTAPVARERDFRHNLLFENIPRDGNTRLTLRLYALTDQASSATVTINRGDAAVKKTVALTPSGGIAFGVLDLAPADPRSGPATITVQSGDKIYGLATLTDNETQQVTAFPPQ